MTGIMAGRSRGAGMAQELQPRDPPKVGPYWLLGRLGAGGMGQVFLGRSPGGRLAAVKVVRAELAEQAEFRHRFAREVGAAQKVSGLFTAPVVDADVDAPVPWPATAYVPGLSLAEAITEHGPLPAASVLALAAGLAEGLGAIHAAGIVHRDLKPSNVLLAEDGPRIIDFGISQAAEASILTGTGLVFGSPSFMSPEQAQGHRVGSPSDVFSLGAVLTFAATGQGPFGTGSSDMVLYRVVFTPPRCWRPGAPRARTWRGRWPGPAASAPQRSRCWRRRAGCGACKCPRWVQPLPERGHGPVPTRMADTGLSRSIRLS